MRLCLLWEPGTVCRSCRRYHWLDPSPTGSRPNVVELLVKPVMGTPLFRREWQRLRPEFKSDPEFFVFVERIQTGDHVSPGHG